MQVPFSGTARYDIRGELGAGAMGVVYRALDTERGEEVALKTIAEVDANRLFHLKQEFRAVADIHHPNLIELHELVVDDARAFFTMELVEGTDLLTWIRAEAPPHLIQHGYETEATVNDKIGRSSSSAGAEASSTEKPSPDPAPWHPSVAERVRRILPQLASGLAALHDAGIIHRDVKPNNILVDDEERVVFLDFGVSVHRDWLESDDMIGGTLVYMAPEQFVHGEIDPASDLYALGVVLYEALTGLLPHRGRTQAEAFDRKLHQPPRPLREAVPEVPDDLAELTMELLATNPRGRPSAHTLSQRLGGGPRATSHHRFVGRKDELALIRAAHHEVARTGRPHLVHVRGPSGIGKTALVEHATTALRRDEALVLRGRCLPHESTPFRALDALVDNLSRVLVATETPAAGRVDIPPVLTRLFPVLGRATTPGSLPRDVRDLPLPELRRVGASALRSVLGELAAERPLAVWIDDFQWADRGSVPILAKLFDGPDAPQILWMVTYREESGVGPNALASLTRPEQQRHIDLGPLPHQAALDLLDDHIPPQDGGAKTYEQALREVGGSPFLLLQLADAIGGDPDARPGGQLVATESFLGRRLRRLDHAELHVMQAIAVADQPVPRHVVASATGHDDINPPLKALVRGRWVRTVLSGRGHALIPEHARVRDAVIESMSPDELVDVHRRLAQAFGNTQVPDAAAIARHRHEAGDRGPAAHWAQRAAAEAMDALAFERAIVHYELAADCDPGLLESIDFLRRRAAALRAQGRAVDAANDLLRAAALDESGDSFDDLRGAGELLIGSGRLDEGRAVLDKVLLRAGVTPPSSKGQTVLRLGWDRLQLWAGLRKLSLDGPDESVEAQVLLRRADACWVVSSLMGFLNSLQSFGVHTQFARAAVASRDPGRIAKAIALDRIYLGPLGKRPKGTARFDAMLDEVRPRVSAPDDLAFLTLMDGYNAFLWGHFADAVDLLGAAEAHYAREGYARWERSLCRNLRLAALEFCGRLDEVAAGYDELLATFLAVDDRLGADLLRVAVGSTVALVRDDLEGSRALLADCTERWHESLPPTFRLSVLTAEVRSDLYEGEPGRALERLSNAHVVREEMGVYQTVRIMLAWLSGLSAAQWARQGEVTGRAAKALDEACQALAAEAGGWGSGLLPLLQAARVAAHDRDAALGHLDDASTLCASHGDLRLHALAADLMRAQLTDGDAKPLLEKVSASGVADAARYMRVLSPC